jgi:hypothetical protein
VFLSLLFLFASVFVFSTSVVFGSIFCSFCLGYDSACLVYERLPLYLCWFDMFSLLFVVLGTDYGFLLFVTAYCTSIGFPCLF